LYLAQEFSLANYHVIGLDLRRNDTSQNLKTISILNRKRFHLNLDIDSKIDKRDDIVIVTLKSYDIDEVLISKLVDSKKEILFLQNGLLVQSKVQSMVQPFAVGTITGIQSKLEGKRIDVKSQNTCIFAKLRDKNFKLAELAVKQNLLHTKLIFSSNTQIEFYEKYVRWVVICCLNIINSEGIGGSLVLTPKEDILMAIAELVSFIDCEFDLQVYTDDISNTMYNLPNNLITSSYSDFKQGKPTEILNELDYVISKLKVFNKQHLMLERWRGEILNGR